jgi:hypothetical protein
VAHQRCKFTPRLKKVSVALVGANGKDLVQPNDRDRTCTPGRRRVQPFGPQPRDSVRITPMLIKESVVVMFLHSSSMSSTVRFAGEMGPDFSSKMAVRSLTDQQIARIHQLFRQAKFADPAGEVGAFTCSEVSGLPMALEESSNVRQVCLLASKRSSDFDTGTSTRRGQV